MHPTICDFIVDLLENAIEAGASFIRVDLNELADRFEVEIEDNGRGMSEEAVKTATDPFFSTAGEKHPERKVGLGLAFAAQTADAIGGELSIRSQEGAGTSLRLVFRTDNIDCPPTGELPSTLAALFGFDGCYELALRRTRMGRGYQVRRSELMQALGRIDDVEARGLITEYLASQEDELNQGDDDGQDEFGRTAATAAEQTA